LPLVIELRAGLDSGLEHLPNIDLALEREAAGQGEEFVKGFVFGATGGQFSGNGEVGVREPNGPVGLAVLRAPHRFDAVEAGGEVDFVAADVRRL
jgi:hypothetical protein